MFKFIAIATLVATAFFPGAASAQKKETNIAASTPGETCTSRFGGCKQYCGTNAMNPLNCVKICTGRFEYCTATGIWYSNTDGNVKVKPE